MRTIHAGGALALGIALAIGVPLLARAERSTPSRPYVEKSWLLRNGTRVSLVSYAHPSGEARWTRAVYGRNGGVNTRTEYSAPRDSSIRRIASRSHSWIVNGTRFEVSRQTETMKDGVVRLSGTRSARGKKAHTWVSYHGIQGGPLVMTVSLLT